MKKILLLFVMITLSLSSFAGKTEVPDVVKRNLKTGKQNANSMGRFFVIAVPPNEDDETNIRRQSLEMYVASSETAILTIENPISGASQQVVCNPGDITTINGENGGFSWDYEIRENESGRPVAKALAIYSTKPVSLYIMNSKGFSTDGYLAIPVALWGKEYTHLSFWDQYENGNRATGGGFVVVVSEDDTNVDIELGGRGTTEETHSGYRVGDQFSEKMDLGEALMILGDGTTRGRLDLSGSKIKADKPIGLISFQQRCLIPVINCTNGRDHLISMMPPEQAWGKTYVSIETARGTGMGDYFRVIAKEENTFVECRWFDLQTGAVAGSYDFFLNDPMDFAEYSQQLAQSPESTPSIRGASVFTSDKPFHVNQYSYSANWDQNGSYDPFMFPVVNADNFTKYTIFQTPSNDNPANDYADNYLNLIMQGDSDPAKNAELLRTVMLDGEPVATKYPQILGGNKIPGTDLVFLTISDVPQGAHTLEGDTPFGAYIYGFANFDSYAWPAATAYKNLAETDTLPPEIIKEGECGLFLINATEFRDFEPTNDCGKNMDEPCPPQIDSHINSDPIIIENLNDNFEYSFNWPEEQRHDEDWYNVEGGEDNFIFSFEVVDKSQDAYVIYAVIDIAGNLALDTLEYYADKFTISDERNFGLVRRFTTDDLAVTFRSDNGSTMTLYEPELEVMAEESEFTLEFDENIEWPIILDTDEEVTLNLTYKPMIEYFDARVYTEGTEQFQRIGLPDADPIDQGESWANAWDVAKIKVETDCRIDSFYVYGRGGENWINVEDWPRDLAVPGVKKTKDIEIRNYNEAENRRASWPLTLTGIHDGLVTDENGANTPIDPFFTENDMAYDANGDFTAPITIPASDVVADYRIIVENAAFLSPDAGSYERNVPFKSDAVIAEEDTDDVDSISNWQMDVTNSSIGAFGVVWPKRRVGTTNQTDGVSNTGETVNDGYVLIQNLADIEDADIVEIYFTTADNENGLERWKTKSTFNDEFELIAEEGSAPDLTTGNWANVANTLSSKDNQTLQFRLEPSETFRVPIRFTPRDVYEANGYETEEFELVIKSRGVGNTIDEASTTVKGSAYLPIIITENSDNGTAPAPILIGGESKVVVTVTNDGHNFPLNIFGIVEDPNIDWNADGTDDAEFVFLPNDADTDFDPTSGIVEAIAPGDSRTLAFAYRPIDDGEDLARIPFIHNGDLRDGTEEPNDINEAWSRPNALGSNGGDFAGTALGAGEFDDVAFIRASTRSNDIQVSSLNFGNDIRCNQRRGTIEITNPSDQPFTLNAISQPSGDLQPGDPLPDYITIFDDGLYSREYVNGNELTVPANGGILTLYVEFDANALADTPPLNVESFTVDFEIFGFVDDGTNVENLKDGGNLTGDWYNSQVSLNVQDGNDPFFNEAYPELPADGRGFAVSLNHTATSGETLVNLGINQIEFYVQIRKDQLAWVVGQNGEYTVLPGDGGYANWTVNVEEFERKDYLAPRVQDPNGDPIPTELIVYSITLTAPAGEVATGNGVLFDPVIQTLLSEDPTQNFTILTAEEGYPISLGARSACIATSSTSSSVDVTNCVSEFVSVTPSAFKKDINADVDNSIINVNFEIPFEFQTTVDLIDLNGNVISTPIDGIVKEGKHSLTIPTDNLSSGVHFIRIRSLEYQDQVKVFVTK